ncbi:hypothetical protein PL260_003046 [Escherichia coli]|nr:hypothetical protein [Escherichia coli]
MDSVHHIWCPLFSQEFQDLPDGAETTLTDIPPDGDEKEIARFIRRQQFIYPGVITQKYAPAPQHIIYLLCCFFMPHPLLWHQKI